MSQALLFADLEEDVERGVGVRPVARAVAADPPPLLVTVRVPGRLTVEARLELTDRLDWWSKRHGFTTPILIVDDSVSDVSAGSV